ncbi:VARLMGL domain-containing protein [Heracleum sosnowskyi]|uniref:VARLMGL domain-containing protein n=1 Tax=Heracleum sosnowskyi TaxID=360622 RepID=A0AAD8N379_9APIA|nr:VARLMGL domain-containing protein [Heracleum sosnowskyi]
MKFSYASLPSSASTTSCTDTNHDDNLCHSKPATSGRIRGILRCFLCFNSLQTHPSDLFKEEAPTGTAIACQSREDMKSNIDSAMASPAPGLVARLMGLDSMPMLNCSNLNSVGRTRSMDSLRDVELVQGKHRKVKSTLSFRDAPAFLELENEEFFILSFEKGGKNKKLGSRPRKSDLSHLALRTKGSENKNGDKKRRGQNVQETNKAWDKKLHGVLGHNNSKDTRTVLCPAKKNSEIVKQQNKKPVSNKKTRERGKLRKTKKKEQNGCPLKNIETESDSENASPVSVLDFSELTTEVEAPYSVHNVRLPVSNSKRTVVEELKSCNSFSSITDRIVHGLEAKRIGDICAGIWTRSYRHSQNYAEMWGEVCKFAERDLRQSKWLCKRLPDEIEEFDEIAAIFELEILDELLQELLDQVFTM